MAILNPSGVQSLHTPGYCSADRQTQVTNEMTLAGSRIALCAAMAVGIVSAVDRVAPSFSLSLDAKPEVRCTNTPSQIGPRAPTPPPLFRTTDDRTAGARLLSV